MFCFGNSRSFGQRLTRCSLTILKGLVDISSKASRASSASFLKDVHGRNVGMKRTENRSGISRAKNMKASVRIGKRSTIVAPGGPGLMIAFSE